MIRECLLHEEQIESIQSRRDIHYQLRCHFCNKPKEFPKVKGQTNVKEENQEIKMGAFKVTITAEDENNTDIESTGLVMQHALSTESNYHNQWILDSG